MDKGMMRTIVVLTALLFSFSDPDLPEPYQGFDLLPPDHHGWYSNAQQIQGIFANHSIKTVIEVGSWLGNSTLHIASLLPRDGKIYAVDHWKGSVEHQPGEAGWYHALPYLYQQFLSNVIHAQMTDKVVPLRMESLEAARFLENRFLDVDLIYLDAGHDTASVYQDLKAWYPYVRGHGILTGDDWLWSTVRAAVEQFASENQMSIYAEGNFWRLIE
jgi:predicted O-methyltransferase YrrM